MTIQQLLVRLPTLTQGWANLAKTFLAGNHTVITVQQPLVRLPTSTQGEPTLPKRSWLGPHRHDCPATSGAAANLDSRVGQPSKFCSCSSLSFTLALSSFPSDGLPPSRRRNVFRDFAPEILFSCLFHLTVHVQTVQIQSFNQSFNHYKIVHSR
jgi:hypothetical protein